MVQVQNQGDRPRFSATLWGVRGSISVPSATTVRYGANTPCISMTCDEATLIFDCGSGICAFNDDVARRKASLDFDLFFTHTHYDHVGGLPFFGAAYDPATQLRIWAGHLAPDRSIKDILGQLMHEPLFPVTLAALGAGVSYKDFVAGSILNPRPDIRILTAPLNHPNGATGYRVEFDGKAICYVTDTEHVAGRLDDNILGLIWGADYVIYDSMYMPDEYPKHQGWGHSTWRAGLDLVEAAGAKTLVVFHHAPNRTDGELDRLQEEVTRIRPGTLVAHDGMILVP